MVITLLVAMVLIITVFDLSKENLDDETKHILYYDSEAQCGAPSVPDSVNSDSLGAEGEDSDVDDILLQHSEVQSVPVTSQTSNVQMDLQNKFNLRLKQDTVMRGDDDSIDLAMSNLDDLDDLDISLGTSVHVQNKDEIAIESSPLSNSAVKQDMQALLSRYEVEVGR